MRRFPPKLTIKANLLILCTALALLLPTFLYLQSWPTLTPTGTLRLLEREYLAPPGEIIAQGGITPSGREGARDPATDWLVTRDADGRFAVAVLEHFWGIFWRPMRYQSYFVPEQLPSADQKLQYLSVSFASGVTPDHSNFVYHDSFLVFSRDSAIVRVEVTEAALPLEAQHAPIPHIEQYGVTTDCTQVAPGVWYGELMIPLAVDSPSGSSSAPWTILRGYDANGKLCYVHFPDAR